MSKQNMQPPRGTYDALPDMSSRLSYIENTAREVLGNFGFGEIRTPIFEFTDVFARNVGDSTDIVSKEMYSFEDRNGESLTLRPEGTACVVRSYYSNGLKQHLPLKLCYIGTPMFRYERPQKGRYRQFHQIGVEVFGVAEPWADVEVISAGITMLQKLGVGGKLKVVLNSLGNKEDRANYRTKLLEYFEPFKEKLSKDSKERLKTNPLRILDSKEEVDKPFIKNAPVPLDYLCKESKAHFEAVKKGLTELGFNYEVDPTIVRGLDYYTHTVFEIHGEGLGSQSQVIGGGRFDALIEQMGGDNVPAVGFGCGVERLEMLLDENAVKPINPVYFIAMGDLAKQKSMQLANNLRSNNIAALVTLEDISFKAQFKRANKANALFAVIIGEDELKSGTCQLKNMATGEQENVKFEELVEKVSK